MQLKIKLEPKFFSTMTDLLMFYLTCIDYVYFNCLQADKSKGLLMLYYITILVRSEFY